MPKKKVKLPKPPTGLGAAASPKPAASPFSPYTPSIKEQGAPAPATPPPGYRPIEQQPFDPNLELAKLGATRNIQLGDADAAWQTGQLARSSGFDQTGQLITSGDAFSPFSQAMQLQDSFKASKLGTQNSYASQGQYNSGAYGRAQNRNALNYARDFDALKTGAQSGYYGISRDRLGTYASNSLGTGTSDFESLRKATYG